VVVPGGHRPGRPDFQQRDRARAQLPVAGRRRIVLLGCTVGAGQTMTTLMTGEVLASLRAEPVAVLDLNPGRGSLADRADTMPAVAAAEQAGPDHLHHPAPSRLAVISSDPAGAGAPADDAARDVAKVFELLSARYGLTLADPGASAVPRVLAIADQLVLVAPASQDAARAIAMTLEWLEAHGHAELAGNSAMVINGVSRPTMPHVEQAEAVARGRCRAIVRIPWDDQLRKPEVERIPGGDPVAPLARPGGRLLGPAAVQAYTALAGVLVAGLAAAPELRRAQL
jgi:MinD-like ATPase involved in chromosome partitioning or flagellar assembly